MVFLKNHYLLLKIIKYAPPVTNNIAMILANHSNPLNIPVIIISKKIITPRKSETNNRPNNESFGYVESLANQKIQLQYELRLYLCFFREEPI
jgi:hypothetical protein